MRKKQSMEKESYRSDDMVVPKKLDEALSMRSMDVEGRTTYHDLLELVVSDDDLERTLHKVVSNRDDWMKVQERLPRSPQRNHTAGSVGGRQSTLIEFC